MKSYYWLYNLENLICEWEVPSLRGAEGRRLELQQSVPATELLFQAVRVTAMGCHAPPPNEQAPGVFQETWQA